MASTREIRRRIRSISSTAQITKAMQMVAASKMRKAQQAAINVRPFIQLLYRIQRQAVTRATDFTHPLLEVREVRKRAIVLVASDFIFSNTALNERGHINAILAVKLLKAAGTAESLVFDESLNETGTPKVVGVLLDPALRPTTIQFVALVVLFGWRGNRRFGGLLPRSSPPRHDVADHTNSLGNLYYKAHHGTGVLREYLDQLKTDLRLRYAAGHERRVLLPIAQNAKLSLEEVERILSEAAAATRKSNLSRREAASHIRKLAGLRQAAHARV